MNLGWWLESATWDHGGKVAVINGDESKITYSELNSLANRLGNALKEKFALREDDVVSTLIGDDSFHAALMFAAFKAGAVFSPLNRSQLIDKYLYDVEIIKPKVLVVNSQFLETGKILKEKANIPHLAVVDVPGEEYPDMKKLAGEMPDRIRMAPRSSRDLAIINFTSATSGLAKGVMLTHGTFGASVLCSTFWCGLKSRESLLIALPLFHTAGLNNTMAAVIARASMIYLGGWDAEKAIYFLAKYRPDWLYLFVPTMVRDMARREAFKTLDLSNLKVQLAGEPVPAEVHEMLRKQGARTLCGYGMTETMPFVTTVASFYYGDDADLPPGAAGRPNKEFTRVKLVDVLTKEEIREPYVKGEVFITGDVLTPGYYNNPAVTRANIDEEGWFHSRDIAYMDDQGWYYISGRTDDIINSGGEKLSLIEVDQCLLKSTLVKDAACIGVGHDRFGEVPAAVIVPAEEVAEEKMKELLDKHCAENIERWKRPRLYIKVDEIPRTMAKRTKDLPKLRKMVDGIVLKDEEGVVSLGKIKGR